MVDMAYDAEVLRRAGQQQRDTAEGAAAVARLVGSITPAPAIFGTVKAAAAFSSAARAARDAQTRGAIDEVHRRNRLGADAAAAAAQAVALTLETEKLATSTS